MKTKDEALQTYKLYEAMLAIRGVYTSKHLLRTEGVSTQVQNSIAKQGTNHRLMVHSVVNSISKSPIYTQINFIFTVLKFPSYREKYS